MKLDSDAQRTLLLSLLLKVPVQTDIQGLLAGPRPDIRTLLEAIQQAPIEQREEEDHAVHPTT